MERGKFEELEASYVLRQLAEGLQFLHSHKIVHRDLKPENILIAETHKVERYFLYHAKIADFGLSREIQAAHESVVSMVGTPMYAAPEIYNQELGRQSFPHRSDSWNYRLRYEIQIYRVTVYLPTELLLWCRETS